MLCANENNNNPVTRQQHARRRDENLFLDIEKYVYLGVLVYKEDILLLRICARTRKSNALSLMVVFVGGKIFIHQLRGGWGRIFSSSHTLFFFFFFFVVVQYSNGILIGLKLN